MRHVSSDVTMTPDWHPDTQQINHNPENCSVKYEASDSLIEPDLDVTHQLTFPQQYADSNFEFLET